MRKAVFLDRDGTINEDVGVLFSEDRLEFIPGALEALRLFQEEHLIFIITNQPGVERGTFSHAECVEFSNKYEKILGEEGICVEKTFFCPHEKKTGCACIKPNTYFIDRILSEYPVDTGESLTIGDHPHDVEMGKRAGTKTVYLLSGHGRLHISEMETIQPDITAENLYESALRLTKKR